MSILQPVNQPSDLLSAGVARIKSQVQGTYRQMSSLLSQQSNFIWHNPKFTPQQILAAFGSDAAELLQLSALFGSVVQRAGGQQVKVVPDGYSVSTHPDGTASITGIPVTTAPNSAPVTTTADLKPVVAPTPVRPIPPRPAPVVNRPPVRPPTQPNQQPVAPSAQPTAQSTSQVAPNRPPTRPMPARPNRPAPARPTPAPAPTPVAPHQAPSPVESTAPAQP